MNRQTQDYSAIAINNNQVMLLYPIVPLINTITIYKVHTVVVCVPPSVHSTTIKALHSLISMSMAQSQKLNSNQPYY